MKKFLYGNTALYRDFCSTCDCHAIILDGKYACCGALCQKESNGIKRVSEPEFIRRKPSKFLQHKLLEEFNHSCAYCERLFTSVVRLEWDHAIPYHYNANNNDENWLPACRQCNSIKRNFIFDTLEQAKLYILPKLALKTTQAMGDTPLESKARGLGIDCG